MSLVDRARIYATAAHAAVGQKRKYTGVPYIVHPAAVVEIVSSVAAWSEEVQASAWLHDVVEDTAVTITDIADEFGWFVSLLVSDLTDIATAEDGNRAARVEKNRNHTARAHPIAKTIKLADLIHNTEDILANDPWFAAVYLREKAELLEVLRDGDQTLWHRAKAQLDAGLAQLNKQAFL